MSSSAVYALVVLFAINLMNFFDRQIIGPVGELIRSEWHLSDGALGVLGTSFTLLYALVGVPLGRLTDRAQRTRILAGGVFAWSVMTGLSGVARNYWQLFVVRLGVGVGEATCSPAATSLLGDLFPTTTRARAMSIFMLGLPMGIGLASIIGGRAAAAWGWRGAFFIAGVPGILCAIAALMMREPKRGTVEQHAIGTRQRSGSPYWLVLSTPTVLWVIASGALHNFNMYALGLFLPSFLIRVHHLTVRQAGDITGIVYGLSGIAGLVGGAVIADRLHRRRADGRLIVATTSIVICAPLMYLALTRPAGDVLGFSILMGVGCGVMYAYYSTVYSTLQEIVEPSLRGTAMALYFCAMYLCGASLGPVGTGIASDYFTYRAAAAAGVVVPRTFFELMGDQVTNLTSVTRVPAPAALEPFRAQGLHSAMFIIPLLAAILAVVLLAASRTVTADVRKLQAWMKSGVKELAVDSARSSR